jgi:hypothetical protein
MLDRLIKRFETAGKIRKQKAGIVQIEALLKEIRSAPGAETVDEHPIEQCPPERL